MKTLFHLAVVALFTTVLSGQDAVAADVIVDKAPPVPSCKFEGIRPTCGPILKGADTLAIINGHRVRVITLKLGGAPKSRLGVLAFGHRRAKFPIPPAGCILHLWPQAYVPFNSNAHGEAALRFAVPAHLRFSVLMQSAHFTLRGPVLSNGLAAVCM